MPWLSCRSRCMRSCATRCARASSTAGCAPGAKLPSESELTAAHGVSRITVRQALGALQAEGLIVKLHGKGAFVSHPKAAQSLNRLQGLNEALALEQHAVSSKRLPWREVKAPAAVARQLQLAAGETVYHLQTLRYLDRQPLVGQQLLPAALRWASGWRAWTSRSAT